MRQPEYDIITVGGGLAGATLAKAMAENGARVLVIERERQFKDRVRGEVTFPWGVAELQKLGVYQLMLNTCARSIRPEQQWRLAARGESQEPEQWWRLSAAEIERAVSASARTMLGDRAAIALVLEESSIDSSHLVPVLRSTQTLIERLQADGETASSTPGEIIERVDLMCEASGSYLSCRSQRKTATVQRATSLSPG